MLGPCVPRLPLLGASTLNGAVLRLRTLAALAQGGVLRLWCPSVHPLCPYHGYPRGAGPGSHWLWHRHHHAMYVTCTPPSRPIPPSRTNRGGKTPCPHHVWTCNASRRRRHPCPSLPSTRTSPPWPFLTLGTCSRGPPCGTRSLAPSLPSVGYLYELEGSGKDGLHSSLPLLTSTGAGDAAAARRARLWRILILQGPG